MHWFFIDGSCFSHPYNCATFYISEGRRATSIDNHGCSVAIRDLACQQTGTCSLLVVNFSPAKAVWAAGSEQHAEHQFEYSQKDMCIIISPGSLSGGHLMTTG
jgi:hypothetical protein